MAYRHLRAVAFDVNETLFSQQHLGPRAPASVWTRRRRCRVVRLLRDGFALTATGQYQPFGDLARQTLRALHPDTIDATAATPSLRPADDRGPAERQALNSVVFLSLKDRCSRDS